MTPIFVLTCDRLDILKKSIQSYHDCIKTPFELIFIDFGSTYPPTIDFLKGLRSDGTIVYGKGRIDHPTQLNGANTHIQEYFKTHPKSNYVVTDSDVALDNTKGDVLEVYSHFLNTHPTINVVGPMLRIDDIPDHYPLKEALVSGKMGLHKGFHSQKSHTIEYKGTEVRYIFASIDTTFGVSRAGTQWARMKLGIRTYPPYGARHLDWYIDPDNLAPDQKYYIEHASKVIVSWSQFDGGGVG